MSKNTGTGKAATGARDIRDIQGSPHVAKQLLALNVGNRPVDAAKVARIAAAQKAGTFRRRKPLVLTNNILTDGQHTLLAILKSGVTVPLKLERKTLKPTAAANGLFSTVRKIKEKLSTYVYKITALKKECRDKRVQLGKVRAKDSDTALEAVKEKLRKAGTLDQYDKFEVTGKRIRVGGDRPADKSAPTAPTGKTLNRPLLLTEIKKQFSPEVYPWAVTVGEDFDVYTSRGSADTAYKNLQADARKGQTVQLVNVKTGRVLKSHKGNLSGRRDARGIFHPFRNSDDYNEFKTNDFDRPSRKLTPETMRLHQYVRSEGGIKFDPDADLAGEMRRLTYKESGKRGLVFPGGKLTPEAMAEHAREDGFRVPRNPAEFLAVLESDAAGHKVIYHPEFYNNIYNGARGNLSLSLWPHAIGGFTGGVGNAIADRLLKKYHRGKKLNASQVNAFISALPSEEMRRYARAYLVHRTTGKPFPNFKDFGLKSEQAQLIREGVDFSLIGVVLQLHPLLAKPNGVAARDTERAELDRLAQMFQGEITGDIRTLPIAKADDGKLLDRAGALRFLRLIQRPAACSEEAKRLDYFTPERVRYHLCKNCGLRFDPEKSMVAFDVNKKLYLLGSGVRMSKAAGAGEEINYGPVDLIGYVTSKKHLHDGGTYTYVHPFAEITREVSDMPHLHVDEAAMPRLIGGAYSIDKNGIVN